MIRKLLRAINDYHRRNEGGCVTFDVPRPTPDIDAETANWRGRRTDQGDDEEDR
jgi:hypothetical protein